MLGVMTAMKVMPCPEIAGFALDDRVNDVVSFSTTMKLPSVWVFPQIVVLLGVLLWPVVLVQAAGVSVVS